LKRRPHHDEGHEQRQPHEDLIRRQLLGAHCLAEQREHDDDA
jgi:hypothetical protein